jgi:hypothetical protein
MLGLSTRKYGQAVRQFTEAYGLEKSAVSDHFIEASRWRTADSLSFRRFLGFDLSEQTPDHTTVSRTRRLYSMENGAAHRKM